jgi:uncharacterized membrane protein YfcA
VIDGLAVEIVAALVFAAFAAGFVDSIAGGGGLITVPALLLAGLPPVEALATNKFQGTFGSGTAAWSYARGGLVDVRAQWLPALVALCAAAAGSALATRLPVEVLRWAMPVVLVAVALWFALKPGLSDKDSAARLSAPVVTATVVPVIAFYDGILGPGTGSFFMLGLVALAGMGVLRATAQTKVLNFASNLGSLAVFAAAGGVWWGLGLAMAAAQVAGARLGARMAMRRGARLIRPLLVTVSALLAARLLWQAWAG